MPYDSKNIKSKVKCHAVSGAVIKRAILFMGKFENIAFSSHMRISPYERYVDDFYLQTTDEGTANDFRHTMNSL